jgi:rubrerythrin
MSQETKLSDILREEDRKLRKDLELALQKISNLEKQSSMTSTHEHTAMPESAKGHKTVDEVADCPTCRPKLKAKFKPELFKEFQQAIKNKEVVTCDGCGELVDRNERECPSCHGTAAH